MSAPAHTTAPVAPGTSEVTIRSLNSAVTTFSHPFKRLGAEVGVRMSAIKVNNGDLILYNPTELDAVTQAKLNELGTVKYIVLPNLVHHVYAAPYAKAYPNAKFIGPEGIADKKKDDGIHLALEMKDPVTEYGSTLGWGNDVDYHYFPDFAQKEIMLFHRPTKTLFVADMLWNLPANEQYINVKDKSRQPANASHYGLQAAFDSHLGPDGWMGKALNWTADKVTPAFKGGMHKVVEQWNPETVVPEHGDVISTGAVDKIRTAYSWVKWDQ